VCRSGCVCAGMHKNLQFFTHRAKRVLTSSPISCLTLESDQSDVDDFFVTLVVVFALLAGLGKEK
jgi:hypothetical protein